MTINKKLFNNKIIVVGEKSEFVGGLEKYVFESSKILNEVGYYLFGFFLEKQYSLRANVKNNFTAPYKSVCWGYSVKALKEAKENGFNTAIIHSCSSHSFVSYIAHNFQTIYFVHDHRYYCKRGHKYFPVINLNCSLPYKKWYCSACAKLSWANNSYTHMLPFLKKSNATVVLSNHMKMHLIKNRVLEKKIHVLQPYVSKNNEQVKKNFLVRPVFSNSKKLRICFVGQLVRGKGVDMLFKAVRNLLKKNYKFTLHLVGEGYQHAQLMVMAEKMKILNNTVFYGKQYNPGPIVASSDIVVVPSRWQEPFALVGVEAMLHKKPVIAFKQGGMDEWLLNDETGYFAKAGSVSSLQKKIALLLENAPLRKKMGEIAKNQAEIKFGKLPFKKKICALINAVQQF